MLRRARTPRSTTSAHSVAVLSRERVVGSARHHRDRAAGAGHRRPGRRDGRRRRSRGRARTRPRPRPRPARGPSRSANRRPPSVALRVPTIPARRRAQRRRGSPGRTAPPGPAGRRRAASRVLLVVEQDDPDVARDGHRPPTRRRGGRRRPAAVPKCVAELGRPGEPLLDDRVAGGAGRERAHASFGRHPAEQAASRFGVMPLSPASAGGMGGIGRRSCRRRPAGARACRSWIASATWCSSIDDVGVSVGRRHGLEVGDRAAPPDGPDAGRARTADPDRARVAARPSAGGQRGEFVELGAGQRPVEITDPVAATGPARRAPLAATTAVDSPGRRREQLVDRSGDRRRRAGRNGRGSDRTADGGSGPWRPRRSGTRPGSPPPHGHGLVAATRSTSAGNVTRSPEPGSPGRRRPRAAGAGRRAPPAANSPSSSRNRTPRCARLSSPGRMAAVPPPTIATSGGVWCGRPERRVANETARTGAPGRPPSGSWSPRALRRATSGGSRPEKPLGQHRLAGPGRADHEQVVPARGGDLERQPGQRLAADVGEVGRWRRLGDAGRRRARSGHGSSPPERPGSTRRSVDGQRTGSTAADARLGERPARHDRVAGRPCAATIGAVPATGRMLPSRPSSPRNAQAGHAPTPAATLGRDEHADGQRRGRGRCPSCDASGGEVDGDPLLGPGEPEETRAARTRSRASRHASSGRPTMVKPGRPEPTWTSTCTAAPGGSEQRGGGNRCEHALLLDVRRRGGRSRWRRNEPVPRAVEGQHTGGVAKPTRSGRLPPPHATGSRDWAHAPATPPASLGVRRCRLVVVAGVLRRPRQRCRRLLRRTAAHRADARRPTSPASSTSRPGCRCTSSSATRHRSTSRRSGRRSSTWSTPRRRSTSPIRPRSSRSRTGVLDAEAAQAIVDHAAPGLWDQAPGRRPAGPADRHDRGPARPRSRPTPPAT